MGDKEESFLEQHNYVQLYFFIINNKMHHLGNKFFLRGVRRYQRGNQNS